MSKYSKIDTKLKLLNTYRPFGVALDKLIQDHLMLQWTYNSNAIEGNTLTYKETSFYLLRGLTAKGKSLKEHLEISNHKDAIGFLEEIIRDKSFVITEKLIRELHLILFKGIKYIKMGFPGQEVSIPIVPGAYKSQDNHVLKADGSIHFYVPAVAVAAEMKRLVMTIKKKWDNTHPIELAAFAHYELVRIHPFTDGNGRVARLLMNLILMSHNFPPAVIKNLKKNDYYNSLEMADKGNLRGFIKIVEQEVGNTIEAMLGILKGSPSTFAEANAHVIRKIREDRKLTQVELAKLSGVEQATISKIELNKEKPQISTLRALAKALKVSVGELLENN